MKEIKTNGIQILLVEVPSVNLIFDIHDNYLVMGTNTMDVSSKKRKIRNGDNKGFINLNKVDWQILGKSTELSEEQMKEICASIFGKYYFDYMNKDSGGYAPGFTLYTVQESYLSLLEANGIVDRNPYELPESGRDKLYDSSETHGRSQVYHEQWHTRMKQWQEAQSKVKHYLVLKRI